MNLMIRGDPQSKRIVYIHQYFDTPESGGGIRSYEFGRRLVEAGFTVDMITSQREAGTEKSPARWHSKKIAGMNVHSIQVPYSNSMSFIQRLKAFASFAFFAGFKARELDGDVIFATSTPLTVIIPAIVAKLFRKTPIIFEVRDLWPEMPIAVGSLKNPVLKYFARLLERIAYSSAEHVVALSPGMRDGIKRVNPGVPVIVIPNSSDIELFQSITDDQVREWRNQQSWLKGRKLVVYVGTFGVLNDVPYLVELANQLQDKTDEIAFLLVGDGADKNRVVQLAKDYELLDELVFVWDRLPKQEVLTIVRSADIVTSSFLPIKEMEVNSANKFFDGLAAGKPIAINYGGWQADLLHESGAGIVLNRDVKLAASQLYEFIVDHEKMSKSQAASNALAHEQFDRAKLFRRLLDALHSVLREEFHKSESAT